MWLTLVGLGVGLAAIAAAVVARVAVRRRRPPAYDPSTVLDVARAARAASFTGHSPRRRILVVDDDEGLRLLLRTTLEDEFALEEASSAEEARALLPAWRPAVVILDVALPGLDGLAFCRELATESLVEAPRVILLTGGEVRAGAARAAGAEAVLRKPFSPLDLVAVIDSVMSGVPVDEPEFGRAEHEQLIVYARDLNRLLQAERAQRRLLHDGYRKTIAALTDALETKDPETNRHAERVQQYALALTEVAAPDLLEDQSLAFGYLLHDIGKIAVPDAILNKRGPLDVAELVRIRQHPVFGVGMLRDVDLLSGEGLSVVHYHHERWDGRGYPYGLAGEQIPLGARIFALADALDAMTSDRPYREGRPWPDAVDELLAADGSQFDPAVIEAFVLSESRLRAIHDRLAPVPA
jgi:ribonuclease P protein subunit RPR2